MSYIISSVNGDWVWQSDAADLTDSKVIEYPVACWRVDTETGETIGLISLESSVATSETSNCTRLVAPPPIPGKYIKK